VCGNGVEEEGEACDEGGETATCNSDCTGAACGDGQVNTSADEVCDEGGETASCNNDCTVAVCGDGHVNASAEEECDEGSESAACDADCTTATCGDTHINEAAGEACDDGGESAECNEDCTVAACGDLVFNAAAGEECDTEDALAHGVCDLETCTVSCSGFWGNCNGAQDDGCESNLTASLEHCGGCGMGCMAPEICSVGECAAP
jgi:hypothetical protein